MGKNWRRQGTFFSFDIKTCDCKVDTNIKQYAQTDLGKNMLVYGAQIRGYMEDLETDKESV